MSEIKLVKQEDDFGCVPACFAMVLNKSYSEIAKDFLNNFQKKGVRLEATIGYLADKGFQIIHKRVGFYNHIDFSRQEMLKPFAPVHLVRLRPCFDSQVTHLVVMTAKGKLLCPQGHTEEEVLSSYEISDVWGLYK